MVLFDIFDSIFDMILLKNDDGSEITALQTKKRNKKTSSDTLDWVKFIQSCLMALIAVILCSIFACNFLLIGLINPEIIHPTIPCSPPYMPNPGTEKFEDAINIDRMEQSVVESNSAYKKCASYDESSDTKSQLQRLLGNVSPEIKAFYNEIRHQRQGELYKVVTGINSSTRGEWINTIMGQYAVSTVLIVMRGCMIFRRIFQSFHTLPKAGAASKSSRTFTFFIMVFLILSLNMQPKVDKAPRSNVLTAILESLGFGYLTFDTSNLFGMPIGINFFSMFNLALLFIEVIASSMVTAYACMIELQNNPIKMVIFSPMIMGFAIPLINLFITLDFMYYYFVMPFFNSKARGIITCMMANEFSRIIAFIYSIFVFNNARSYLDSLTSDIVFYVLLFLNLRSLYKYMNEKSGEDSIEVTGCDMKQHLYKNVEVQGDINQKKSGMVNAVFGKMEK